jgi:hypothetical protein
MNNQPAYTSWGGDGWFADIGMAAGEIAWVVAFLAVYIAAVGSAGWVIGIAMRWIPASLAAPAAFLVLRYLWPVIFIVALVLVLKIMG